MMDVQQKKDLSSATADHATSRKANPEVDHSLAADVNELRHKDATAQCRSKVDNSNCSNSILRI